MIIIIFLVGYILYRSWVNKNYNLGLFEGQELERLWTILPAIFLLFIAFPSIRLLYLIEEYEYPEITIRVLGHQWYWTYEYRDLEFINFDSYISQNRDDPIFRLLNVDNSIAVPFKTDVRIIVSRIDVIHSWTIPSLGVRVDAVPGRLNQLTYLFNRVGVFVGQCSEICGSNHSFIPIIVSVIPRSSFLEKWL